MKLSQIIHGDSLLEVWAYKSIEDFVVCSLYNFVGGESRRWKEKGRKETYSIKPISNHTGGQTP
jgi:hypothetical protein